MTTTRRLAPIALLLASCSLGASLEGCSSSPPPRRPMTTTAAAPETQAIINGTAEYGVVSRELASIEQAPIDRVYEAAQLALRELELRLVEKTKDRLGATVAARTSHDDRVTVALGRVTGGVTDVKIKVGFWGDESTSRAILTEIRKKLAETTPSIDTATPLTTDDPGILAAGPRPSPVKPKAPAPVAAPRR